MKRRLRPWAVVGCCALLLTGCRNPESRVHDQIRQDAKEKAVAAADYVHREGLMNHQAFEAHLRTAPEKTVRSYRNFRWEGDVPYVLVSFSSNIQKTEVEGAGRYSAVSCSHLRADSKTVSLIPAVCPADIPLAYGSDNPDIFQLPEIAQKVQSRW
jgi:hypothetical protein